MMNQPIDIYKKRTIISIIIILFLSTANIQGFSQEIAINKRINWQEISKYNERTGMQQLVQSFESAYYPDAESNMPYIFESIPLNLDGIIQVEITNIVTEQINKSPYINFDIKQDFQINSSKSYAAKEVFADILIFPFRLAEETNQLERLISFTLNVSSSPAIDKTVVSKRATTNSVLSSGSWYKVKVTESGVYRIGYDMLKDMGIDVNSINPKNIRIFGNGGGMLPQPNFVERPDDLQENAIYVAGQADNSFDKSDYILFYAQGPHPWVYNDVKEMFLHQYNYYSDFAYYFITVGNEAGNRVQNQASLTQAANYTSTTYQYRAFYEKNMRTEVTDYVKSGRDWFADEFSLTTQKSFPFNIPTINKSYPVKFVSSLAGRSSSFNSFELVVDGNNYTQSFNKTITSDYLAQYCNVNTQTNDFIPKSGDLNFSYTYLKPNSNSMGWMNYIVLNATSNLVLNSGQMKFRDIESINFNVTEYRISSTLSNMTIWNVADIQNPKEILAQKQSGYFYFRSIDTALTEYVAFEHANAKVPIFVEKIDNQNLHAIHDVELIIITHPKYIDAANKLAEYRRNKDGYTVEVVKIGAVYNEFCSGAQDITAIRDFVKHVYDQENAPGKELKYLLLIGDASYDFKDVLTGNTNDIPTYQSFEIYSPIYSYASDDYYGFLDENEGDWDDDSATRYHKLDIGIGRLPVNSASQAMDVVDKIINYTEKPSFGDWRNIVAFVSDDVDDSGLNAHFEQSEVLTGLISYKSKLLNPQKIYMDAYEQVASANGHKYPEATKAINNRMNSGALIINYIGHGGEVGWAHERVLEVADIKSWDNFDKLPVFVTATCEFSRYDDPERVSAGELVLLNPNGGGVALLTTSRVVWVHANNDLTNKLYDSNIFDLKDNKHKTLGQIIVMTKNRATFHENTRKFILLGDPSMKLALPDNQVVATSVPDTLKAFQLVEIKGEVRDYLGGKMSGFNGTVYPTIFDKQSKLRTLDNDNTGKARDFNLRKNIIYKGKASVVNGDFSFQFVVPKDISYFNGQGKISFYACNDTIEASGYYDNIVVGGTADTINYDTLGPMIELYIGDTNFVSGGLTNENPILLARVYDESGINTVGNGIGHEIIAFLDDDNPTVLNDYYQSYLNSYQAGEINYQFFNLTEGLHSLVLKVWDIQNNSATASIDFVVTFGDQLLIEDLFNYPNPFSRSTTFSFEHNQAETDIHYSLGIYSLQGNLIKMIEDDLFTFGNRETSISWSPYDDYGNSIEAGIYLYRLIITTPEGESAQKSGRLIYVH
ncbi:MAG: type IX secretion system sortase PorU [Bacteroidetes bacterium]|nr:type IX secretion system sortase PorU [Bacteroidota bacterium]MBT4967487.1 type IX secretion system sortase PorU [Bacteroidota bacterium]